MYGAVQSSVDLSSNYFRIYHRWLENSLVANTYLVMSFFVYYPFIKQMDKQALQAVIQETSDLEDEDW